MLSMGRKGSTSEALGLQHVLQDPGPQHPEGWEGAATPLLCATCEMPGSWARLWGCCFSAVPEVVPAALTRSLHLATVVCFLEVSWY